MGISINNNQLKTSSINKTRIKDMGNSNNTHSNQDLLNEQQPM